MLLCSGIEFEKAMSDWSMYELGDIVRVETRDSSDHIVPCGSESAGYADDYGALQQNVDNGSGKKTLGGTTFTNLNWWEEVSLSPPTASGCSRGTGLTCLGSSRGFQDSESSNEYAKMGIDDNVRFSSNPVHRTGHATDCKNSKDGSLVVNKPLDDSLLKHKDGEKELIDYDWPDIGDFEDIDALFRSCENMATGNEHSWFSSSSNAVSGSEDAYESGLPSTCSELSGLSSTSGHLRTSSILLGGKDQTCFDFHDLPDYQSYSNFCNGDGGQREKYAPREQAYVANHTSSSAIPQRSIDVMNDSENFTVSNSCMKPFGSQFSPSVKRKDHPSDHTSSRSTYGGSGSVQDVSAKKLHSHVSTPDQNLHQMCDPLSEKAAASSHAIKLKNGFSIGHLPVAKANFVRNIESETNSCSSNVLNNDPRCTEKMHQFSGSASVGAEGKGNEPNLRPQTGTLTECPSQGEFLTSAASTGKMHYKLHDGINGNTRTLNHSIKHPAIDIDYSAVPEASCINSGYDGQMSLEETSFHQLQDAMHELDVRTKLRIRDSLYRLARSVEQRHGLVDGIYGGARGLQDGGTSNNSAAFLDAETETNPIDRSIAQLLFHSPTSASTNIKDDSNMRWTVQASQKSYDG